MKKLLTLLLTLLMVFSLVGCNSKEETPVVEEPEQQEVIEETIKEEKPEIVGGYVDVEDGTITNELKDIFNSTLDRRRHMREVNKEAEKETQKQLRGCYETINS